MSSLSGSVIQEIIFAVLMVLAFIPAIVLHECAHGFAAYRLGDNTAKNAGRLTLNPVAHVDLWGTVIIPGLLILMSVTTGAGMIFGYAKPVPYNPRNFKNIRQGEVIVGLAGPASNLLMCLIGAAIAHGADALVGVVAGAGIDTYFLIYVWYFGAYFCMINLCLAFFNLIPIPPLDGSSIVAPLLTDNGLRIYYKVQRYAMFILLLLILVLPYCTGIDILGWYLNLTAGNIANLLLGL